MLRLMTAKRAPTRQELADILDELFRRVLDDGERTRAMRPNGPPPWAPDPRIDPRYDDLEPHEWDRVPYPPEQWQEEWRWAVVMNAQEDVADLVGDALDLRDLDVPRNRPEWRMLRRLALIAAAKAHAINARREWGDYSDGWPDSAPAPERLLPVMSGTETIQASARSRPNGPETAAKPDPERLAPRFSESSAVPCRAARTSNDHSRLVALHHDFTTSARVPRSKLKWYW